MGDSNVDAYWNGFEQHGMGWNIMGFGACKLCLVIMGRDCCAKKRVLVWEEDWNQNSGLVESREAVGWGL